jgi:hypothetical protein
MNIIDEEDFTLRGSFLVGVRLVRL